MKKAGRMSSCVRVPAFVLAGMLLLVSCDGRKENPEEVRKPETGTLQKGGSASIDRGDFGKSGFFDAFPVRSMVSVAWSFAAEGAVSTSPVIMGDTLFFGSEDGSIYQLESADGKLVWKFLTQGPIHASPFVGGNRVYAGSADGKLYCLESRTGELLWEYDAGSGIVSSPIVSGGSVFSATGDGTVFALDATKGSLLWKAQTGSTPSGSIAMSGNSLFIADVAGNLSCLEAASGKLQWTVHPGTQLTPPLCAGKLVIAGTVSGEVHAVEASDGAPVWMFPGDGFACTAPAFAEGTVYFGTAGGTFYAINADDGKEIWNRTGFTSFSAPPSAVPGTVYAPESGNRIVGFDGVKGTLLWEAETGLLVATATVPFGRMIYTGDLAGNLTVFTGSEQNPSEPVRVPPAEAASTTDSETTGGTGEENVLQGPDREETQTAVTTASALPGDGISRQYVLPDSGTLQLSFTPSKSGAYEFVLNAQQEVPVILKLYDDKDNELVGNLDNDRLEKSFTATVSAGSSYSLRAVPANTENAGKKILINVKLLRES